jgi:prepilin-type N-terminal cleavage/methylation domain-containing protein
MRTQFNKKGITLIELLVVLVIGGIVLAGIYRIFIAQLTAAVWHIDGNTITLIIPFPL